MKKIYCSICLAFSLICSVFSQSTLSNGLLACYGLNGNATDASGNNINGTVYGSPTLGSDHYGNANGAYYFDGTDDYIDISNSLLYQPTQWTYSAWVKFSSLPAIGANSIIMEIGGTGAGQTIGVNNNSNVSLQGFISTTYEVTSTNDTYVLSGNLPALSVWYHIVGVREMDTIRLYVNGIQVNKARTSSTSISYGDPTNFATIGVTQNAANGFFNGYMDNVRIYSRPLLASEISQLYTSTSSCSSISAGILNSVPINTYNFIAYPNPSKDGLYNITFPTGLIGIYQVKVYDSKGMAILNTTMDTSMPQLDMSSLHKGIYMISFAQNATQANAKVVIE